jgi:hypothetical protein
LWLFIFSVADFFFSDKVFYRYRLRVKKNISKLSMYLMTDCETKIFFFLSEYNGVKWI